MFKETTITDTFILCLAAFLIGVSKAGFGGGFGMIVTPMLASIMPAKTVVGFMLPLLFATDVFSLFHYWKRWNTPNVARLIPGTLLGIAIGSYILNDISDVHLKKVIGGIACVFAVLEWYRSRLVEKRGDAIIKNVHFKRWHGVIAGVLTGIFSTLAHIGGLVVTMYLLPQRLSNQAFVGTATAIYFIINLVKFPFYIRLGLFSFDGWVQNAALLPFIALGVITGISMNQRFPRRIFSRIILFFVFATGIKLLFW